MLYSSKTLKKYPERLAAKLHHYDVRDKTQEIPCWSFTTSGTRIFPVSSSYFQGFSRYSHGTTPFLSVHSRLPTWFQGQLFLPTIACCTGSSISMKMREEWFFLREKDKEKRDRRLWRIWQYEMSLMVWFHESQAMVSSWRYDDESKDLCIFQRLPTDMYLILTVLEKCEMQWEWR